MRLSNCCQSEIKNTSFYIGKSKKKISICTSCKMRCNFRVKKFRKEREPKDYSQMPEKEVKKLTIFDIKKKAQQRIAFLRKSGIIKYMPCEICGKEKTDAHHDDYNKPEKVRFLCRKHHGEFHSRNVFNQKTLKYKDIKLYTFKKRLPLA